LFSYFLLLGFLFCECDDKISVTFLSRVIKNANRA
jgi:hypothetical protein